MGEMRLEYKYLYKQHIWLQLTVDIKKTLQNKQDHNIYRRSANTKINTQNRMSFLYHTMNKLKSRLG